MKQIGIFIGFDFELKIKNQDIDHQSINQLMNLMINCSLEREDTKIVIAAPSLHTEFLYNF